MFGAKDANAKITLRTNMKNSGGQSYWYYPLNNANNSSKSVYPTKDSQKIKSTDFGSTLTQATNIRWIAYNEDRTKYCVLATKGSQFYNLSINDLTNNTLGWRTVGTGASTSTPTDIGFEHTVYIVAYAYNSSSSMCPVANFEVFIHKGYPKMKDELTADGDVDRTLSYLEDEDRYEKKMDISFDDDNPDLTLDAPTTPLNNMSLKPTWHFV